MTTNAAQKVDLVTLPTLFDRLAALTSDMAETCASVEARLSAPADPLSVAETARLQDFDRLMQNMAEISKLFGSLGQSAQSPSALEIADALKAINLPSLKAFLEQGDAQDDRGSVDLF